MIAEMPVEDVVKVAERLLRDLRYVVSCLVDYEDGTWKLAFRAEKELEKGRIEFTFDDKDRDLTNLLSRFKRWYGYVWGFDLNEVAEDVLKMEGDRDG